MNEGKRKGQLLIELEGQAFCQVKSHATDTASAQRCGPRPFAPPLAPHILSLDRRELKPCIDRPSSTPHAARITHTHTHTHAPHALHATHATIKMRERYYTYMVCLMIRISKRWGRPPPDGRHTKSFTCVVHASAPPIAATAKEANRFSASSSVSDRSFACQLASRNTRRSRLTVHQTVCRPNRRTTARCPVSLSASTNAALAAAAHSPLLWWP